MWMCFLCYHSEWLGSYAGLITRCLSSAFSYCLPLQHSHFVSTLLGAGLNKSQTLSVLLGQSSQLFLQCHLFYNSNRLKDLTCHHLKGMTTGNSCMMQLLRKEKHTVTVWKWALTDISPPASCNAICTLPEVTPSKLSLILLKVEVPWGKVKCVSHKDISITSVHATWAWVMYNHCRWHSSMDGSCKSHAWLT